MHLIDITYELCHRIVANEEIEVGLAAAFKNLIYAPDEVKAYKPTLERRGFTLKANIQLLWQSRNFQKKQMKMRF